MTKSFIILHELKLKSYYIHQLPKLYCEYYCRPLNSANKCYPLGDNGLKHVCLAQHGFCLGFLFYLNIFIKLVFKTTEKIMDTESSKTTCTHIMNGQYITDMCVQKFHVSYLHILEIIF
ncbi:hypothetical protein O6H91_04G052900 [Diphasiastrum complanatum]|uniref:Uncharacterized protein n=1 Tax=Diphasiastrum complanatum TaxID=34168 RepID=A0ACC2DXH6_DIPCM|nr:hypothetical protein O6H91_04G052900 [Diphasiastrum complanatum]